MNDLTIAESIARSSDPYRAAATSNTYVKDLWSDDGLHTGTQFWFEDESSLTFKVTYETTK